MPLKAAIWKEGSKLLLQTGYNVVLIRLIQSLPSNEATYRDETHTWYIDIKHETSVINWLKKLGYLYTEVDKSVPVGDDCFAVLGLLPTATWEVCEAAYRALCKVNHPDMGGNVEVMKQINDAWAKIKQSKGK